jgi:hypothetical protein
MSIARECDLCGDLFKPKAGDISIGNLYRKKDADEDGNSESWSDIDFCHKCSGRLMELIKPALDGCET